MSRPNTTGPVEWTVGRTSATTPQLEGGSVAVPRLELCVEREPGQPAQRSIVLDGEFFRIGSHPVNNLVLTDPLVSRFHCSLARSATGFRLSDSGSLNGTRLAGVRVREADLPLPECRIELGDSVVRVRDLGAVSQDKVSGGVSLGALYGISVAMRRLFELIKRVAGSGSDVLIEGESGTGKELIATEVMRLGGRAAKPLVIVDCGAVSPQLIESELFGHLRGSFTGATRDRAGAFEAADGGTVFLDEIGELPLDMQPKLLRALAAREVRRIGENRVRRVDVRVIAATNRQLEREVNSGRFREDLYYRLSVLTVRVPPLRERMDDLQLLVEHFLAEREATDKISLFTPEVLGQMKRYDWPGNVRELRNYVERRVVLEHHIEDLGHSPYASETRSDPPRAAFASAPPVTSPPAPPASSVQLPFKEAKDQIIADFERAYLTELLHWAGGNVSKAARKAQLDRMHLHRLFQRYGLRSASALEE
jgi:transcriptional regulator with GAF, ATPase, and Fis domain